MVDDGYRSYVIRVRRHRTAGGTPDGVRLEVEDLLGGGRAALDGEPARSMADGLASLIGRESGIGSGGSRPVPTERPGPSR